MSTAAGLASWLAVEVAGVSVATTSGAITTGSIVPVTGASVVVPIAVGPATSWAICSATEVAAPELAVA